MFKSIIFKEWIKTRWFLLILTLLGLVAVGKIFLTVQHNITFNEAHKYWYLVLFQNQLYYKSLKFVPLAATDVALHHLVHTMLDRLDSPVLSQHSSHFGTLRFLHKLSFHVVPGWRRVLGCGNVNRGPALQLLHLLGVEVCKVASSCLNAVTESDHVVLSVSIFEQLFEREHCICASP